MGILLFFLFARLVASGEAVERKVADYCSPLPGCFFVKAHQQWVAYIFPDELNRQKGLEKQHASQVGWFAIKNYADIDEARKAAEVFILAAKPKLKEKFTLFYPNYKKGDEKGSSGEPYPAAPPVANKIRTRYTYFFIKQKI